MNPDHQKQREEIAEKWLQRHFVSADMFTDSAARRLVKHALSDLDQLRQSEIEQLQRKLDRLPADWLEDSSLETWFPLTARELRETKEELARVKEAIRDEPELPDGMPDEMWDAIKGDRDATEKALRLAVQITKGGILQRLTHPAQPETEL